MLKFSIFNPETLNTDIYVVLKEGDQFKLQVDTMGGGIIYNVLGYFDTQDELRQYMTDIQTKLNDFFVKL
jgi:hypothetical protein